MLPNQVHFLPRAWPLLIATVSVHPAPDAVSTASTHASTSAFQRSNRGSRRAPGEEKFTRQVWPSESSIPLDQIGKFDQNTSCWIRCQQSIAGNKWGFMAIPRVGQEVVVDFIEGDPNRPLITGCVYNAEQMPAYDLPGDKAKTYIKTNSTAAAMVTTNCSLMIWPAKSGCTCTRRRTWTYACSMNPDRASSCINIKSSATRKTARRMVISVSWSIKTNISRSNAISWNGSKAICN